MEYFIDQRINLTLLACATQGNSIALRSILEQRGLTFADANAFAMFALYGFLLPSGRRTLKHHQGKRLAVLDEYNSKRRTP
jgi:hypothetical protein